MGVVFTDTTPLTCRMGATYSELVGSKPVRDGVAHAVEITPCCIARPRCDRRPRASICRHCHGSRLLEPPALIGHVRTTHKRHATRNNTETVELHRIYTVWTCCNALGRPPVGQAWDTCTCKPILSVIRRRLTIIIENTEDQYHNKTSSARTG